jgi:hypothetical protein
MPQSLPLETRFWSKVDKTTDPDGCWLWTGYRSNGRGKIGSGGKRGKVLLAHRASYEITYGAVSDDEIVHHKCHNKLCVNPNHLELVASRKDHIKLHSALSSEQQKEILIRSMAGESRGELAKEFGVSRNRISQIKHYGERKSWDNCG